MNLLRNIKFTSIREVLELARRQIEIVYLRFKTIRSNDSRNPDDENFVNLIRKARQDLEQAKNYFANVSDPDLVDYAVHKILANQSFYSYLLKKAKEKNITSDV